MDLLLLGGIALIGNQLNKQRTQNNSTVKIHDTNYEKYPLQSSHMIKKADEEMKTRMKTHFDNPKTIGNHNLVPFFRSEKSQNTNDDFKSTRLSMFTGVDNVEFTNKKEVENFVENEFNQINVNLGSKSQPFDKDRFVPSQLQTNNLPFEQIKVGPGLGIDVDTPSDGGFHSHFRIKPHNVNDYRINQFQNRMVGGKQLIDKSTNSITMQEPDKFKFYSQCEHPTMATKSYLTSQTDSSNNDIQKLTHRGNSNSQFVVNVPNYDSNNHSIVNSSRKYDSTKCAIEGHPHTNTLQFSSPNYIMHDTERESCTSLTNVNNQNKGLPIQSIDEMKQTLRGSANDFIGTANGSYMHVHNNDINNNTVKDTKRSTHLCEYTGILGGSKKHEMQPNSYDTKTKKDDIHTKQMQNTNTIQGSLYVPTNNFIESEYNQSLTKEITSTPYTPNMSRVNILNNSIGTTIVTNDNNCNNVHNIQKLQSINNYKNCNNMGQMIVSEKPIVSDRCDFNIFRKQIETNPFNKSII